MLQRLLPSLTKQLGLSRYHLVDNSIRSYAVAAGSMALVKDLREKSGAPISDVKSALVEANWDPGDITPLHSGNAGATLWCQQSFNFVYILGCGKCRVSISKFAQKRSGSSVQEGECLHNT